MGDIKGDTRSLDYGSYDFGSIELFGGLGGTLNPQNPKP